MWPSELVRGKQITSTYRCPAYVFRIYRAGRAYGAAANWQAAGRMSRAVRHTIDRSEPARASQSAHGLHRCTLGAATGLFGQTATDRMLSWYVHMPAPVEWPEASHVYPSICFGEAHGLRYPDRVLDGTTHRTWLRAALQFVVGK